MKKLLTVVSNAQGGLLFCGSAAVLLAACGGGAADSASDRQNRSAALSYGSATNTLGTSAADDADRAAAASSSTEEEVDATAQSTPASVNHLYVATTGSDSNPGTKDLPFLTIAHADSLASAGSTIHVAGGTYNVSAPASLSAGILTTHSGTSSAHIRFTTDAKSRAKIVFSGTGIAWDSKGSYVDIHGFDISGSGRIGILAEGANVVFTRNFVHDLTISGGCNGSGGAGIDTYGPVGNAVINANIIRNIGYSLVAGGTCNTVQGIYIGNANNVVTNNIVSGVAAVAIQQWHGATASTIVNNTVFHSKMGILIGQGDAGTTEGGSQDNYVANNIVYDNLRYGIIESGKVGGNNRYVNNLVKSSGIDWSVMGAVSGSVSADPLFVNYQPTGTGDYHVQIGSLAIDGGTSVNAPIADYSGVARPRGAEFDIGAYEF